MLALGTHSQKLSQLIRWFCKVSDAIKDILYAKTADKVDSLKPEIASSLFGNEVPEVESEVEVDDQPVADATEPETTEEEE